MSTSSKYVDVRVGHRVGKSLGRGGGGIASYLPSLYGVVPIWCATEVTDGAVSALADLSLGLYELTSPTNNPTASGGLITFDGSNDTMGTTDATLLGWGTLTSVGATLFFSGYVPSNPAGADAHAWGWDRSSSNGTRMQSSTTRVPRPQKSIFEADSTGQTLSTDASWVIAFEPGAEGDVYVYRDGVLVHTMDATGATPLAPFYFGFGSRAAGANPCPLVFRAAAAMPGIATTTQRNEWTAWHAAGCPLGAVFAFLTTLGGSVLVNAAGNALLMGIG